jgi:hypothetical protein
MKKHITLSSMDENPLSFSMLMMYGRKKTKKREKLCTMRDEGRA